MQIGPVNIGWKRFYFNIREYDGFWIDDHKDCCGCKAYGYNKLGFYFVYTRRL